MVNLVAAQKPLLHFLVRWAGLRQHTVDVDGAGTVITFWVPKDKVPKEKGTTVQDDIKPGQAADAAMEASGRPAVVLVHGFAAEGIVTWQFQVGALAKHYDVYVPDLLFFGGSTSPSTDRSPGFQAECLATALRKLGVGACTVVGFSYGGMVAFKMAEAHPDLVRSLVVSGSVLAKTDSLSETTLEAIGVKSSAKLLRWASTASSAAATSSLCFCCCFILSPLSPPWMSRGYIRWAAQKLRRATDLSLISKHRTR